MSWPIVPWSSVPVASAAVMREADADAERLFQIGTDQLMEVAGFQLARFVSDWLGGAAGRRVAVVAGAGNNGGDALVSARFLAQRGADVISFCIPPKDPSSPAANHARTLRAMGLPCQTLSESVQVSADLIVDGLLGTGIRLPLRPPLGDVIAAINRSRIPAVAIDLPSGLDSESGEGDTDAVQATATLTLGLPKPALQYAKSCGRLFTADIGLPAALFKREKEAVLELYRNRDLVEIVRPVPTSS